MTRPRPYSKFLTETAQWCRQALQSKLLLPTLLAADESSQLAVVCPARQRELYVLGRQQGKIARKLPLPETNQLPVHLSNWEYSPDGMNVCAYDRMSNTFHAWSLTDGELILSSKGDGQMPPAMLFMTGGRLAICDGPVLHVYQLGGEELYNFPVGNDVRGLVMHSPLNPKPILNIVYVTRMGLGGYQIDSLRLENDTVIHKQEGPIRRRPERQDDKRIIRLTQLINIPGSTAKILILSEEEELETRASNKNSEDGEWEYDQHFVTRLHALDPQTARFYKEEITLDGQHCLEFHRGELHVMDELGRRRSLTGIPLRLESADWRLSG